MGKLFRLSSGLTGFASILILPFRKDATPATHHGNFHVNVLDLVQSWCRDLTIEGETVQI